MTGIPIDLGRPASGDVVELILEDHRRFEDLLRQLRDATADRAAVRQAFAALHVAHADAEEREVYPTLREQHAIGAHEVEHGKEEHAEGNAALLAVLELERTDTAGFDDAVEELTRLVSHHLTEEELTILNPARTHVPAEERARLGQSFAAERNAQIEGGCGSVEHVRELVERDRRKGLLPNEG